jgi:uncharacterized protein Usg
MVSKETKNASVSSAFRKQLEGYGLTTANILYRRPDHPWLLQEYVWQEYDLCPNFPVLNDFLNFWLEKLEGPLHSVTVAHARYRRRVQAALRQAHPFPQNGRMINRRAGVVRAPARARALGNSSR